MKDGYPVQFAEPSEDIDKLAKEIVDAGFKVHKKIGPGLLERYYRDALIIELKVTIMVME